MPSVQGFRREGMAIMTFEPAHKKPMDEWLNPWPNDLLSVLVVRDHPLTGEILVGDEELVKLNDKRILHIEIQHGWSWSNAKIPHPFGAQIRVLDGNKAIVVLGPRFRLSFHSAPLMDWSNLEWDSTYRSCVEHSFQERPLVESFEATLPQKHPGLRPYLSATAERLYDRTVFIAENVNGEFFLEFLLKQGGEPPLRPPGFEDRGETSNLGRWSGMFPWSWWGATPLTEPEQRSLVVLSASLLRRGITPDLINSNYLKCLEISSHP